MSKGFTPSSQSHHELRGEKSRERIDKKYPFYKPLRKLQYEDQIPFLFDSRKFEKPTKYDRKYSGKVAGIDVRLFFGSKHESSLCAKSQKSLDKAHKTALDRLLEKERDSII